MDSFKRTLSALLLIVSLSSTAQLAFDSADTGSKKTDLTVKDITAPRTDLLRTETGKFIFGPATRIKFKIIEEESGLASTNFKIADMPYMKSDGRQMVPHELADGAYRIEYYSVDKDGNQEQIRMDDIYIDKKGPVISAGFNTTPSAYENGLPIFSDGIKLVVEAVDEKVDVQKLTYKINDGPVIKSNQADYVDLTEELSKVDSGLIKIEILAYDHFYNLSKEVVEFKLAR